MDQEKIDEKIRLGGVHCLVTFEIAGKPKNHVEKTLDELIKRINEEKLIDVIKITKEEVKPLDDTFFSGFAEIEMVLPDLDSLTYISINLTPVSIEIISPDEFVLEARQMQNHYNDLISQMHEIGMNMRAVQQKHKYLQKNFMSLLHNTVAIILTSGPKKKEDIARLTGAKPEEITKVLEHVKKQGTIRKEGELWILNSPKK